MRLIRNRKAVTEVVMDAIRGQAALRGSVLVSIVRIAASLLGARPLYFRLLMLEHRLSTNGHLTPVVRSHLRKILESLPYLLKGSESEHMLEGGTFRAIVLRAPRWDGAKVSKGVLLIKFTETFPYFYHQLNVPSVLKYFQIVLEPSWAGYCLPEILFWAAYEDPVYVQASEKLDRDFLRTLGTNLVPLEIGASNWVDHRVFRPLQLEKRYDAVYVANLSPIKRVHIFLKAVSIIVKRRKNYRAALVLSNWGVRRTTLEQLLDYYDVRSCVTVAMNQSQARLNEILNESKVSVLLSRKEGSNKTLFESMFADIPVILLRSNIGVNKSYINEDTGRLATENELPDALLAFCDGRGAFRPREWAMANIAPEKTTEMLEGALGASATPLVVKVNTPEATYMDQSVRNKMPNIVDVLGCFRPGIDEGTADRQLRSHFSRCM